jgi:hypothetical protein
MYQENVSGYLTGKRILSWTKAYFTDTDRTCSNIISRDINVVLCTHSQSSILLPNHMFDGVCLQFFAKLGCTMMLEKRTYLGFCTKKYICPYFIIAKSVHTFRTIN